MTNNDCGKSSCDAVQQLAEKDQELTKRIDFLCSEVSKLVSTIHRVEANLRLQHEATKHHTQLTNSLLDQVNLQIKMVTDLQERFEETVKQQTEGEHDDAGTNST